MMRRAPCASTEFLDGPLDRPAETLLIELRAHEVLKALRSKEEELGRRDGLHMESCAWHPEYGAWMVEGTPRVPYGGFTHDLARVEANMRVRPARLLAQVQHRQRARAVLACSAAI